MILGIAGRKRSGKDTAGAYVMAQHRFIPYGLSAPIKHGLHVMLGFSEEQLYGEEKDTVDPRYGVTPRQLMQTLGTEWGQHMLIERFPIFSALVGRQLWVKRFYHEVYDPRYNWVISDVRFKHEIDGLREMCDETFIIWIDRDGTGGDGHESEPDNLEADYRVDNNGTFDDLVFEIQHVMEDIYGRTNRK